MGRIVRFMSGTDRPYSRGLARSRRLIHSSAHVQTFCRGQCFCQPALNGLEPARPLLQAILPQQSFASTFFHNSRQSSSPFGACTSMLYGLGISYLFALALGGFIGKQATQSSNDLRCLGFSNVYCACPISATETSLSIAYNVIA